MVDHKKDEIQNVEIEGYLLIETDSPLRRGHIVDTGISREEAERRAKEIALEGKAATFARISGAVAPNDAKWIEGTPTEGSEDEQEECSDDNSYRKQKSLKIGSAEIGIFQDSVDIQIGDVDMTLDWEELHDLSQAIEIAEILAEKTYWKD